ncbi:MAG: L-seryl-tRNA(Sec) selenium transferase, partial [Acidobacteriota bacterium]
LEFDLRSGNRGERAARSERLAAQICGAEAAVVVNNCAAAACIVLSVFAAGCEVIVSRGELVEIGGDFRIPDILAASGAVMREVGTTNRTKPDDYENAVNERTAIIMKVHPSNFRVVGFTRAAEINELASIADRAGAILYEDAGSGALIDLAKFGIDGEPDPKRSIAAGADLVSFSGDKLLGGPQAGIIVGRRELIEEIRRHPLYRTYRPGKLIYAALEATLEAYAADRELDEIPVLRMLSTDHAELRSRSKALVEKIKENCQILTAKVGDSESVVGGGAVPGAGIRSPVIILTAHSQTAADLMELMRTAEIPVIARIEDDGVRLDLRTVGDVPELFSVLLSVDQRLENSSMKAARHSAPSKGNAL